jgi:hypothetical protein
MRPHPAELKKLMPSSPAPDGSLFCGTLTLCRATLEIAQFQRIFIPSHFLCQAKNE